MKEDLTILEEYSAYCSKFFRCSQILRACEKAPLVQSKRCSAKGTSTTGIAQLSTQPHIEQGRRRDASKSRERQNARRGCHQTRLDEMGTADFVRPRDIRHRPILGQFIINWTQWRSGTQVKVSLVDESIVFLGDPTIFSTSATDSRYWQVKMAQKIKKTSFTSHHRLFYFTRMPFGIEKDPDMIQRAMNLLLMKVRWRSAHGYLADIVIFLRTPNDQIDHFLDVLKLLHYACMTLDLK